MITIAAEAFLRAVQAQTHERAPSPKVYREGGDLRDVQLNGQIDVAAAMQAALLSLRQSSETMEEAGSAYVDASQHISVDGIWTVMFDAGLREGQ